MNLITALKLKEKLVLLKTFCLIQLATLFLFKKKKASFFESPLNSSELNIWVVSLLNTSFVIVSLDAVVCKMILLPHKDIKIPIQLVHMDKGRFKKMLIISVNIFIV